MIVFCEEGNSTSPLAGVEVSTGMAIMSNNDGSTPSDCIRVFTAAIGIPALTIRLYFIAEFECTLFTDDGAGVACRARAGVFALDSV